MIIVLTAICIAVLVIGIVLMRQADCAVADTGEVIGGVAVVLIIACLIGLIILGVCVSKLNVIDDKIAMYEEENNKIETQIAETVKQYQEYEHDIFVEVAPESAVTLVSLYPELKADTLVQKQIEVYVANNEVIKELKASKINGSVLKWWLYFGG